MEAMVLRRAENVSVAHLPGTFTSRGWVTVKIGQNSYRTAKMHKNDYLQYFGQQSQYPVSVISLGERNYWLFRGKFYWDNDNLDRDQIYALLVTREQREVQRIERAQAMVAMGHEQSARPRARGAIPDDIKQMVWIRDQGRCRGCGSVAELQFDHIIPVAMGGGSNPENLQILCGPCNRRKGAGLTVR